MQHPITATINGHACFSMRVVQRSGSQPSTARAELAADKAERIHEGLAEIVLSDRRSTLRFKSLIVREVSVRDQRCVVELSDRRADWRGGTPRIERDATLGQALAQLLEALDEGRTLARLKRKGEKLDQRIPEDQSAPDALEALLLRFGQSFTITPHGELRATPIAPLLPRRAPFIAHNKRARQAPSRVVIVGGPTLRETVIDANWELACADAGGELQPLDDLLSDWGMQSSDVASAVLTPGALELIATGADATEKAQRAALLREHAWRRYRWTDDRTLLPFLVNDDGTLAPPRLKHDAHRPMDRNVTSLADPWERPASPEALASGFHVDAATKTLRFDRPTGVLNSATPPVHDTREEGRSLDALPAIRLSMTRLIRAATPLLALRAGRRGEGRTLRVVLGDAIGRQSATAQGRTPDNQDRLKGRARGIARLLKRALPTAIPSAVIAGAIDAQPGVGAQVVISASQQGLLTELRIVGDPWQAIADVFSTPAPQLPTSYRAAYDERSTRTHLNAYTHGPLVLKTAGNANQSESYVGAEADDYDGQTNQLSITNLAPFRTPFHLPNANSAEAGGWFFAAPVRQTPNGVELLEDENLTTSDFDQQSPETLGGGAIPEGADGLLVQALDGSTGLALFDRPLVAQHRGLNLTDYSIEVREIDGDELDAIKRGGLHFPLVVSLSPQHQSAGVGGTASNRGWAPALNLKDFTSGSLQTAMRAGRGLFAEQGGQQLGHLAHLPNQGGPIMADASNCTKHRYGQALGPDGTYTECAGHISTEAFFKIPGDDHFDAPFLFEAENTAALVPIGFEYRAEIKFKETLTHEWNGTQPDGRWVITYKLPFTDAEPPATWTPDEQQIATWGSNQAGPSFDWAPPPSDGVPSEPIDFPGITVKAVGYAPEDASGVPDASEGGGLVFLPGELDLQSGNPFTHAGPDRSVVLHPSIALALGLPSFDGSGAPHSGVVLKLDGDDELCITPVDGDGDADASKSIHLKSRLAVEGSAEAAGVELVPQASNPGSNTSDTIWKDDDAGELHHGDAVIVERPASAPSITGSRSNNAALASLLTQLESLGLIVDDTVA